MSEKRKRHSSLVQTSLSFQPNKRTKVIKYSSVPNKGGRGVAVLSINCSWGPLFSIFCNWGASEIIRESGKMKYVLKVNAFGAHGHNYLRIIMVIVNSWRGSWQCQLPREHDKGWRVEKTAEEIIKGLWYYRVESQMFITL